MKVSLGKVLSSKRKAKRITQQELADFVGVSKTSVSKWENGQTYPDITLLPLLAAYFDVSIDALLNYEPELSKEEIQHIYLSIQKSFDTQSAEEVWEQLNSFIHRYYSCYPFILQMGMLLLNHYDLLPGENTQEKADKYLGEALKLFIHIRVNTQDIKLINEATKMEAYCLLVLKRPDEVLDILGQYVPTHLPADDLIVGAFHLKGDPVKAEATSQSGIFQNLFILISSMTNYLQLLLKDPVKLDTTYQRELMIIETFNIEALNPAIALNFCLSAASVHALIGNKELLFNDLNRSLAILQKNKGSILFKPDDYFNRVQDWLDQQALGNQPPRNAHQVVESINSFILTHTSLDIYREEEEMKQIINQLTEIRERRS